MKEFLGVTDNFSIHGGGVDHMIAVIHWFMLALFVGWTLFFLFTLWRFAARRNPKADYTGVRNHVSTHLEVGVVVIEAVLLLGFAFPLWRERTDDYESIQAKDPVRVRAIGYQFAWNYHYPGADGKFGRIDLHLASNVGDPCIDPDDPNGWDDFTTSVLKVPVDKPSIVMVTSTDVIHNYAIVPMRVQQDAIPGQDIPMWFTPTKQLETYVVCAQLCGDQHANMRGTMEVVRQSSFDSWAAEQSAAALERNTPQKSEVAAH
ncbi:cytochrome c oxidase subunit II [Roseibacillus ishigakijimensis]|uniref:cytochrome-c oxidase n=1 Tax=Roseibacillus ishigakijimensis TaxID=454146 RepID=A0A934RN81_9BACT|nr:cytochrome c oxidase subunit II [Roseibacillus ishigakijimensis]MBK1834907.1 cytochrome c oxidase subunit II [Roseibacillus ishigakijimensis]